MKKIKRALHNMFIAIGFGTMVYVPMLLLDKGLNDTMQSVSLLQSLPDWYIPILRTEPLMC